MAVVAALSAGFIVGAAATMAAGFRWVTPRPPGRPVTLADLTGPRRPERVIWDGHSKWVDPRLVFEDTFGR